VEISVSREGNIHEEILMNLMHFVDLLIIHENNSRISFFSRICCPFQDNWKLAKFKELGICEVRESSGVSIQESQRTVVFMNKSFGGQEEAKSKTSL
jgi:hypothetical protein